MLDRVRKLELIERSLALRHKIKVHESMKSPETHEDLAIMLLSKWELEDELRAVDELLQKDREDNVDSKKTLINKGVMAKKKRKDLGPDRPTSSRKKAKKKSTRS